MSTAIPIVIMVLAVVVVAVGLTVVVVAAARRRGDADMTTTLAGEGTVLSDRMANLAGVSSHGRRQWSGNGHLALTDDEIVFVQWIPRRTIRIPRRAVVGVEVRNRFAGRFRPRILVVRWTGDDGHEDAAGWNVGDLDAWLAALGGPTPPGP